MSSKKSKKDQAKIFNRKKKRILDEEARYRLEQFYRLLLQADKAYLQSKYGK